MCGLGCGHAGSGCRWRGASPQQPSPGTSLPLTEGCCCGWAAPGFALVRILRYLHPPPLPWLQVVSTILASATRLVANKAAWADPAKRTKIEDVALLLQVNV